MQFKYNRQELCLVLGLQVLASEHRLQVREVMIQHKTQGPLFVSSSVINTSLSTMSCGCQLLGKRYVLKINSPKFGYQSLMEIFKDGKHISFSLVSFV